MTGTAVAVARPAEAGLQPKQAEYAENLKTLTEAELYLEVVDRIWFSGVYIRVNLPNSPHHWQRELVAQECSARGQSRMYEMTERLILGRARGDVLKRGT